MVKEKCTCGHLEDNHKELNKRYWNDFNRRVQTHKDSPKNREKFWRREIETVRKEGSHYWACSICCCREFKLDNLDYIEKLARERKLV